VTPFEGRGLARARHRRDVGFSQTTFRHAERYVHVALDTRSQARLSFSNLDIT